MKATAIQTETCVNTIMRNEWNFLLFVYLFHSFIYLFSLEVKSIYSWGYTRNCYLYSVSFDVFNYYLYSVSDNNNVLCSDFRIFLDDKLLVPQWRKDLVLVIKNESAPLNFLLTKVPSSSSCKIIYLFAKLQ